MALTITHSFVSAKADGTDNTLVRPSDWNAEHTLTGFPGDASVFLDGNGNFNPPNFSSLFSQSNNWTGYNTFDATGSGAVFGVVAHATSDGNSSEVLALSTGGGLTSGSTVDNFYGLYVNNVNSPFDATLNNLYGIFIVDQANSIHAGPVYNFYSQGANTPNVFEGMLGVGVAPQFKFHVAGDTRLQGRAIIGDDPVCDNAKVTIYQNNMSNTTNTSMVDIVCANNDNVTDLSAVVIQPKAVNNVSGTLYGVFVSNHHYANVGASKGIYIDSPFIDLGVSVGVQYGIYVNGQNSGGTQDAYNIYSQGSAAKNAFEGPILILLTNAPDDSILQAGQAAFWFDPTPGSAILNVKAKDSNGTVVGGSISLT